MARKGMSGATIRYMAEIDEKSNTLRKEIKSREKEIVKMHEVLNLVDMISRNLGYRKDNNPDWNNLIAQYTQLKSEFVQMNKEDDRLVDEYNELHDALEDRRSVSRAVRRRGRKTMKKFLSKPFNIPFSLQTTSPPKPTGKGSSRKRRSKRRKITKRRKRKRRKGIKRKRKYGGARSLTDHIQENYAQYHGASPADIERGLQARINALQSNVPDFEYHIRRNQIRADTRERERHARDAASRVLQAAYRAHQLRQQRIADGVGPINTAIAGPQPTSEVIAGAQPINEPAA